MPADLLSAMPWVLLLEIAYVLLLVAVVLRILQDTQSSSKAAAYLLLVLLVPVAGIILYLAVGLNYRKKSLYDKKLLLDKVQSDEINRFINQYRSDSLLKFKEEFPEYLGINNLLFQDEANFATKRNRVQLLSNGEQKFPELLAALRTATNHIHIEYYIFEDDGIGGAVAEILAEKARAGVKVRFIYDDFGSRSIRRKLVPALRAAGAEAFPFYKINHPIYFANRLNYRNHRKIVIIDGKTAFVSGINVSDKYINTETPKLFWRDTHLRIDGEAVWGLQKIFLADWNFCSGQRVSPTEEFFQNFKGKEGDQWVQLAASGPDSPFPGILYSYLQALAIAKNTVNITTPYFIPGEEFISALQMAALRGVKVRLLVPGISDSFFVNAVSKAQYSGLLQYGIEIYLYQKGFVHAKTMVCDDAISVVGTANLDHRSFDLNFEVNAIVYDRSVAAEMVAAFENDLSDCEKIVAETWQQRKWHTQMVENVLRLAAPLL